MALLDALLWFFAAVLATVLAGAGVRVLARARKRRLRRRQYVRTSRDAGHSPSAPAPLAGRMTPERAAAIRAHAERRATKDWLEGATAAASPYASGTSEHVLWYDTYQITLHDLAEAEAGAT